MSAVSAKTPSLHSQESGEDHVKKHSTQEYAAEDGENKTEENKKAGADEANNGTSPAAESHAVKEPSPIPSATDARFILSPISPQDASPMLSAVSTTKPSLHAREFEEDKKENRQGSPVDTEKSDALVVETLASFSSSSLVPLVDWNFGNNSEEADDYDTKGGCASSNTPAEATVDSPSPISCSPAVSIKNQEADVEKVTSDLIGVVTDETEEPDDAYNMPRLPLSLSRSMPVSPKPESHSILESRPCNSCPNIKIEGRGKTSLLKMGDFTERSELIPTAVRSSSLATNINTKKSKEESAISKNDTQCQMKSSSRMSPTITEDDEWMYISLPKTVSEEEVFSSAVSPSHSVSSFFSSPSHAFRRSQLRESAPISATSMESTQSNTSEDLMCKFEEKNLGRGRPTSPNATSEGLSSAEKGGISGLWVGDGESSGSATPFLPVDITSDDKLEKEDRGESSVTSPSDETTSHNTPGQGGSPGVMQIKAGDEFAAQKTAVSARSVSMITWSSRSENTPILPTAVSQHLKPDDNLEIEALDDSSATSPSDFQNSPGPGGSPRVIQAELELLRTAASARSLGHVFLPLHMHLGDPPDGIREDTQHMIAVWSRGTLPHGIAWPHPWGRPPPYNGRFFNWSYSRAMQRRMDFLKRYDANGHFKYSTSARRGGPFPVTDNEVLAVMLHHQHHPLDHGTLRQRIAKVTAALYCERCVTVDAPDWLPEALFLFQLLSPP